MFEAVAGVSLILSRQVQGHGWCWLLVVCKASRLSDGTGAQGRFIIMQQSIK